MLRRRKAGAAQPDGVVDAVRPDAAPELPARPRPFAVDATRPLPRPRPTFAPPVAAAASAPDAHDAAIDAHDGATAPTTAPHRSRPRRVAGRLGAVGGSGARVLGGGARHAGSGVRLVGTGLHRAGSGTTAAIARHPRAGQRSAFVALGGGIAAFVITATAGQAASIVSAPAHHKALTQHRAVPVPAMPAGPPPAAPAVPATQQTLPGAGHSAKPAPVDHGVISKLAANGIPAVALNAYRVAAARMANVEPSCGIPWYLLAGIGREESDHGQYHGAVLHADGVSTPKIIGPALDGKTWDYIPAPGNGLALDGDAKYAHALGPMQFIPSTWALYGADANGDGKADIFNINDAALGAARYLCAAGGDLRTVAGRTRAVLTYNNNDQYLAQVLALADAYRKGIPVTGVPVGITTGNLPTLVDTGYIPPANPASPTAVDKTKGNKHPAKGKTTPTKGRTSTAPGSTHPGGGTSGSGTPTTGSGSPGSTPTGTGTPTGGSGGSGTSKPTPTPTPTGTCTLLQQLLGCKG